MQKPQQALDYIHARTAAPAPKACGACGALTAQPVAVVRVGNAIKFACCAECAAELEKAT